MKPIIKIISKEKFEQARHNYKEILPNAEMIIKEAKETDLLELILDIENGLRVIGVGLITQETMFWERGYERGFVEGKIVGEFNYKQKVREIIEQGKKDVINEVENETTRKIILACLEAMRLELNLWGIKK